MRLAKTLAASTLLALLAGSAVIAKPPEPMMKAGMKTMPMSAMEAIADWPKTPKMGAEMLIKKYGEPTGVMADRLVWKNNGMWQETIVYRDEIPHNFPKMHTDYLEQRLAMQVPVERYDDLAEYDGSVIVERTKGTIAARCDMEELNMLALNLAVDVIQGKKTAAEARAFYGMTVTQFVAGEKPAYTQKLMFDAKKMGMGDADKSTIKVK